MQTKIGTIILLMTLAFFSGYSQGKTKVASSDIKKLEVVLYKIKKGEHIQLDPKVDELAPGTKVRIQLSVTMDDGTTLVTPLKGKEGLQMKQFAYNFKGATSAFSSSSVEGMLLKAATNSKGTFIVNHDYNTLNVEGEIGIHVSAWHKENPENTIDYFMPVQRPNGGKYILKYTTTTSGFSTNVEVSMNSESEKFPLAIKVTVPGQSGMGNTWNIDPTTETVEIHSFGRNGANGQRSTTHPTGPPGQDGGNGGDVKMVFQGEAKNYETNIVVHNMGGKGGEGGLGTIQYGPRGRDGRDGKVIVVYEDQP